jgi:hypothetical protein
VNSGLPLNVTTTGVDPAGVGVVFGSSVSGGRPDRVGEPNANNPNYAIHTRQHWFNVNAFSAVPAGQYRGGNAQRNQVEGPGWWRADVGLFKNVNIAEKLHLQLRGEAFNVFNNVNFGTPNATLNSPIFGTITTAANPRIMEFALKYLF